jgi:DNA-binding CsgD family transcriptional regulator
MKLTKREIQILHLIINGLDYRQIANDLYVSINTVLTHRKNIKSKLGVRSSAGIVREAINQGYYHYTIYRRVRPL